MGTTQIAAALFQLQQFDLEMDRLTAEQHSLTSALQNDASLRKARAEHALAQQQLTQSLQDQKDAEAVLADLVQRLKHHEQRLYSGSVTNPKELSSIQQEVQYLRTQQACQEETVLEIMERAEALSAEVEHKASALSEAEHAWQTSNAAALARREQLETHLQELRARKTTQTAGMDAELIKRYEGMRKTKQGRVVSKVEQNSCQWCRVILTPSELQRVRISSELQTCSNCGRILYYDR